jgi:hypothetical protein
MKVRALAGLLLVLFLCAASACGRKAKPEPLRGGPCGPFPTIACEVIRCTISR